MLRMIGSKMALAAGFRLAGLLDTEGVSRVAGSTRTKASIGIDSADSSVWPTVEPAAPFNDNETAMALNTSKIHIIVMIVRIIEKPQFLQYPAVRKKRRQRPLRHLFRI